MTSDEIRLNLVLKCAKLGFWDFHPNDEKLNWSARGKKFFGVAPDEAMTYAKLLKALHPEDRERVDQTLQRVLSGRQKNYEIEFRTIGINDKVERIIEACGEIQTDEFESPIRLIGVSRDVTEERMRTLQCLAAQRLAEETSQAKTQFVANMSHEMRTPLGIVLGFADLALEENRSPEQVRSYLRTIKTHGTDLLKLINEVLDLSKVEANKVELEERKFNLPDALQLTVSSMQARAAAKSLTLSLESDGPIPTEVSADSARLRQILMNLIGNAIKFTEAGGIKVTARVRPEARIGERIYVEIDVSDTGIGIPEKAKKRVFEPFTQADASTTRKYGGTGLGLSISRKLAEAMGGSLELVESSEAYGTCFRLRFADSVYTPEMQFSSIGTESSISATPDREKAPPVLLNGVRVLLVEDAHDNQVLVSRFLSAAGATVELAENGREAVELALSNAYDVVLMDLQMPVMDGYTATETLRSRGYIGPIVALTAHAMKDERTKCLNIGFDDHLTKPISRGDLVNEVAVMAQRLHS